MLIKEFYDFLSAEKYFLINIFRIILIIYYPAKIAISPGRFLFNTAKTLDLFTLS